MRYVLRLRRARDFARVRRGGAFYRHPCLLLSVAANELPHNRYGIVASRKLGIAVARNRCKRRLRAILQHLHGSLRQGYDIVLVARARLLREPFASIDRIVSELCAQAELRATNRAESC